MIFRDFLQECETRGLMLPEQKNAVIEELVRDAQAEKEPGFVRILVGIGAWFSALFFMPFLGLLDVFDNQTTAYTVGLIVLTASVLMARMTRSTFPSQLSLALAFTGNVIIVVGSCNSFHDFGLGKLTFSHAVVCAILFVSLNNSVYRFVGPVILAVLATCWAVETAMWYTIYVIIALEMLLFLVLLLSRPRSLMTIPLMYASAIMLPLTILYLLSTQIHSWRYSFHGDLAWISNIIITAGLIYLFSAIAGGRQKLKQRWILMAVGATIVLGFFTNPGILIAIGLLAAGFAFQDRILTALALLFLPVFLVIFYYSLSVDLAYKSVVIAGSGMILLLLYWLIRRNAPEEQETAK